MYTTYLCCKLELWLCKQLLLPTEETEYIIENIRNWIFNISKLILTSGNSFNSRKYYQSPATFGRPMRIGMIICVIVYMREDYHQLTRMLNYLKL